MRFAFVKFTAAAALILAAFSVKPSSAQNADVQKIVQQMDAAAAKFQSATADLRWDNYERVVRETTTQTGIIYFQKKGNATDMGAVIQKPAKKVVAYSGGLLKMYEPNIDSLTLIDTSKNQAEVESFLTLGFGGSGTALEKQWAITSQGTETIDGVQTAKLDLVPKQESIKKSCTHITIWLDTARGVTLKQQIFMPSGDQKISYYTNIKVNGKIDAKTFEIKTTSKTAVKRP
ncbi:outer membrane lipoprotein-sorting protein [Terriglobus albidus]|uniref:Outer membrane lipoprotein-sorting protein n=1 Tax=Terriglobus albidus TaxID=1592106 RepID=A0A5B9E6V4_9BACT|nr:outer membrane lipoprotein-sorting protein [Terriglobus albidus]QEE28012.1 outer membrane lipoprotein-sorting protein [Terriglobus albidus]